MEPIKLTWKDNAPKGLNIWNNIMKCKNVTNKVVFNDVTNKETSIFWYYAYVGHHIFERELISLV